MRFFILTICCITLFIACGSDDEPEPTAIKPNYFPDAVGTKWVYRTYDGSQWTWLVSDEISINDILFQNIDYLPEVNGKYLDLLIPSSFRVTQNQVFFQSR